MPDGYRYVGYCRCGFGPNAFYQDASGNIVHASQLFALGRYSWAIAPVFSEKEMLESQAKMLEQQLEQIKKRREELKK